MYPNPDGTVTVTCGTASVIIGKPSSGDRRSISPGEPGGTLVPKPSAYPGVTPVKGGVSIYIVRKGQHEDSDPLVGEVEDIDQFIRNYYRDGVAGQISSQFGKDAPALKLRWIGKAAIDVDDVLRSVRDATGWEPTDITIHIEDDDSVS
jgi:hypothetical protein